MTASTHEPFLGSVATRSPRRWPFVAVAATLLIATALFVATRDDGSDSVRSASPTSVSIAPGTTVAPTTAVPASPTQYEGAVFPDPAGSGRFHEPGEAAAAFATDFVGFENPIIGEFRAGDARSGEIEVRPTATGPVTTVLVRQLDAAGTWWVIGGATANIQVTQPSALETISSPVRLRGISTAFEATVDVEVREAGSSTPIGRGWVMGGANGDMAPFDAMFEYGTPSSASGVVMLFTRSMENGQVWEASVVPVRFAA